MGTLSQLQEFRLELWRYRDQGSRGDNLENQASGTECLGIFFNLGYFDPFRGWFYFRKSHLIVETWKKQGLERVCSPLKAVFSKVGRDPLMQEFCSCYPQGWNYIWEPTEARAGGIKQILIPIWGLFPPYHPLTKWSPAFQESSSKHLALPGFHCFAKPLCWRRLTREQIFSESWSWERRGKSLCTDLGQSVWRWGVSVNPAQEH